MCRRDQSDRLQRTLEGRERSHTDTGLRRANSGHHSVDDLKSEASAVFGATSVAVGALVRVQVKELLDKLLE